MKKIFILSLLLLFMLTGSVFASKNKFKDNLYDFKNIDIINLVEASYEPVAEDADFTEDNEPVDRVLNTLRTLASKKGISILLEEDYSDKADVDLYLIVHKLGTYRYWRQPWTEIVTDSEPVVVHRHYGRRHHHHHSDEIVYVPVTYPVYHPGQWITNSYVEIEFIVKDHKTNKVVYSVRDDRQRQSTNDYNGMVKRICNDFLKDIK